jgi:hypothetical protein
MKGQPGKLTRRSLVPEGTQTLYDFPGVVMKPLDKTFGQILYDSDTGKILTRTPRSWCKSPFRRSKTLSISLPVDRFYIDLNLKVEPTARTNERLACFIMQFWVRVNTFYGGSNTHTHTHICATDYLPAFSAVYIKYL